MKGSTNQLIGQKDCMLISQEENFQSYILNSRRENCVSLPVLEINGQSELWISLNT